MEESAELSAIRAEYEKQIFDLRQLLEVSKSLNSMLDYGILIDAILFNVMAQMKVLKVGLFSKKGLDSTAFSLSRSSKGFDLVREVDYSIADSHPIIGAFTKNPGCYSMDNILNRLGSLEGLECLGVLAPSLLLPLKAQGTVIGILIIGDKIGEDSFDVYEREYALNLASLAAVAIHNAFLFEMTTTDMMTRLKLKHFFYSNLLERMSESAATGKPIALIMIDIDHFKLFNDTHGHSCGDAVLKHVARLMQDSVRGDDIAARYGGEEFCLLLLGADASEAMLAAERLRQAIEGSPTLYENIELGVTVSMGVAQYEARLDLTGKSLIDRADRALYVSKDRGRNRVTLAESVAV